MIKIKTVVENILNASPIALEAMRMGILNLSAFADLIHAEVEEKTFKTVKRSTIVVALSRIAIDILAVSSLFPVIALDELSIKSPLCDITFEKTVQNVQLSRKLANHLEQQPQQFLTVTQGINELTIIVSEENKGDVLAYFANKTPKALYEDLVGVTVKFSEKYLAQPNVIFSILTLLATKRVNLIEIISTFTELTVIIEKKDMEETIQVLNTLFQETKKLT